VAHHIPLVVRPGEIAVPIFWRHLFFFDCLFFISNRPFRSCDFRGGSLSNLLFGLIGGSIALPHHEAFSVTLGVRLESALMSQIKSVVSIQQTLRSPVLSPERSNSPNALDPCLSHASEARPILAMVGGNRSVPDPKISCCTGSCVLRSPSSLATKYIDLKINLEPGKNFVDDLNAIDLMLMIRMIPFLERQLSWFMTMSLYGGANGSEN
jgi:hypothetical protein